MIALCRSKMKAPCAETEMNLIKYIAKLGTLLPDKGYHKTVEPQARSRTVLLAEQAGAARLSHHCPLRRSRSLCCDLKALT